MTMTIDDEIQMMPATSADSAIVPEGRYTAELVRLEKAPPSSFKPEAGPRIKWIFNLYDAKGDLFFFNGDIYEFWRTTSRANSPRAHARQYAEALLGRSLGDSEVPQLSSLLGLRMSALISYEPSANDPSQETTKFSSFKHVPVNRESAPAAAPAKPAPTQVSADPSSDDIDRALMVTKLEKQIVRLRKLDEKAGVNAQAAFDLSDMATAPLEEIHGLMNEVQAAINAALED